MKTLRAEVIRIHDEAMDMMGPMYELELALNAVIAEQQKNSSTDDLQAAIRDLAAAQEAMMDWMRKYKEPGRETPHQEARVYFEEQKVRILDIRTLTVKAISNAEKLLQPTR